MTTVEDIAAWAHGLKRPDVPEEVLELARAQTRSVLGSLGASAGDGAASRIVRGLETTAPEGPAPLLGTDRRVDVAHSLYAANVLSMALDFDDYLLFGHTGHSSVLVPLALGYETHMGAEDRLVAQIAANEVEARLGGACLVGPLNGQMWSFIHSAGAALAAGLALDLDSDRLAHALAISLYQAPRPVVPGFMAPDSKLLTAAEPVAMGVRAARLAAGGATGPLDVLDRGAGFFSAFSYAPIRGLLGRLGEGWATRTLCVKPYPGCAYVDTTVDALLSLGEIDAGSVRRVQVHAGILTCGMDALSETYSKGRPTPVSTNFSIPLNVAAVLLAGRLAPDEINEDWLGANEDELREVARKVELQHDWEMTRSAVPSFSSILPPGLVRKEVGIGRLLNGLRRARSDHPRVPIGLRDAAPMLSELRSAPGHSTKQATFWDDDALREFEMTFPARVRVILEGGRVLEARADVPRGGAGHEEGPDRIARAKLAEFGPRLWGAETAAAIDEAIESDSDDLPALVGRRVG